MNKAIFSILTENRKAIFNILEELRSNKMLINQEQIKALIIIAESQEFVKMELTSLKNEINLKF